MDAEQLLQRLLPNQRRGSKPRCHLLTHGDAPDVAERLSALLPPDGHVGGEHVWLPRGFDDLDEAKLGESPDFLNGQQRETVTSWWLKVRQNANTPNWDIASTCSVEDRPGLLLVEAKAHSSELSAVGKTKPQTPNGEENHSQIGRAIEEANDALNRLRNGWALSRDSHYQMSNRFAWGWKLASMKVPVVLVYLGFLQAAEMSDCGKPFNAAEDWSCVVRGHGNGIVPESVWDNRLDVEGTPLYVFIRSMHLDLPEPGKDGREPKQGERETQQ
jgi:hypothetical protein